MTYPSIPTSYFIISFTLEKLLKFIKYISQWNWILNSEKVVLLISLSYGQGDHKRYLVWEDWRIGINSTSLLEKQRNWIHQCQYGVLFHSDHFYFLPSLHSFFFLWQILSRVGTGTRTSRPRSTNSIPIYVTFPWGFLTVVKWPPSYGFL